MSFEYGKNKKHGGEDAMWTSYSDLFLGLSVIFLLLYVTASLRQGTDGIRQFLDNKQLTKENQDLKQQLKVYESLKQDYLETQAAQGEQETYDMLMKKLDLLQDEASQEKNKLREAATENEKKEKALNQYQQIVRNIISANVLSKARIKNRDVLITKKEDVIDNQSEEITGLEGQLEEKRQEIAKDQAKIENLEGTLFKKLKELKASYKAHKFTEKVYKQKQEALTRETEAKVASLKEKNEKKESELRALAGQLENTTSQLSQTTTELQKVGSEKQQLEGELAARTEKFSNQIQQLKSAHESQKALERAAFEKQLNSERLSGAEKAKREAMFRAQADQKAKALADQVAGLEGQQKAAQGELNKMRGALSKTQGDLSRTQSELATAQENLNARKKLAGAIKGKFNAQGVRAEVDPGTGDVLLSFDGEYFETGASQLKPGMKKVLEKAMPAYAQSLFEDKNIADKLENVEIVGFASPTYKGKFIDPAKLKAEDRQAVNYNLDLSYSRARSIFDHMFSKMTFQHKGRLLPLVKVTGRSFLMEDKRALAGATLADYCSKNDCAKKQTVIIKFKLKD
jgi:myosin heavy subunit